MCRGLRRRFIVRSSIVKGLVVGLLLAAVLVPAAAAEAKSKPHHPALKLALVPLPKTKLGSAAAGLQLSSGSGPYRSGKAKAGYELAYGDPAREIVRWVREHGCDLVAMSTHGHRAIADIFLGTTAIRVQHRVKVPVLLLRAR